MSNREMWQLTIVDTSGHNTMVLGPERELRPIYEKWRDSTYEDSTKIVVQGIADDAARSKVEIAMKQEDVRAIFLEEFY